MLTPTILGSAGAEAGGAVLIGRLGLAVRTGAIAFLDAFLDAFLEEPNPKKDPRLKEDSAVGAFAAVGALEAVEAEGAGPNNDEKNDISIST